MRHNIRFNYSAKFANYALNYNFAIKATIKI